MSGEDSTHECPAPGCVERVPFHQFACQRHWFAVPPALRTKLVQLWRWKPGTDEYFQCRAACLRALGVEPEEVADQNAGVA